MSNLGVSLTFRNNEYRHVALIKAINSMIEIDCDDDSKFHSAANLEIDMVQSRCKIFADDIKNHSSIYSTRIIDDNPSHLSKAVQMHQNNHQLEAIATIVENILEGDSIPS